MSDPELASNEEVFNVSVNSHKMIIGEKRAFSLVFAGLLLLAAILRGYGVFTDFYIDEIWSLRFAESARNPFEIIFGMSHDNNHILNTLYMYFLRDKYDYWYAFRLPSFFAGMGSVIVASLILKKYGKPTMLAGALIFSISFLMVLYSSEARGYSTMVFFALLSFYLNDIFLLRKKVIPVLVFNIILIMGVLSHLTFLHFLLAVACWSFLRIKKHYLSWRARFLCFSKWFALPLIFFIILYVAKLKEMIIGGGEVYSLTTVIAETLVLVVGAPLNIFMVLLGGAVLLVIVSVELTLLGREKRDLWVFYVVVIFLSPAVVLYVRKPEIIYVRYFLISIAFLYLLMSRFLGRFYDKGRAGYFIYFLFIFLYCFGNIFYIKDFIRYGRGEYMEAVRYMAENTEGETISVSSDHDFRNSMVISYYSKFLPPDKKLVYYTYDVLPTGGTEWALIHSSKRDYSAPENINVGGRIKYIMVRQYPYSGKSGWNWFLYRKEKE